MRRKKYQVFDKSGKVITRTNSHQLATSAYNSKEGFEFCWWKTDNQMIVIKRKGNVYE